MFSSVFPNSTSKGASPSRGASHGSVPGRPLCGAPPCEEPLVHRCRGGGAGTGNRANNAVFTIVNAVLLRNLPVPKPEQVMFLGTQDTQGRTLGVSLRDFEDWRTASRSFSGMSFLFNGAFNVGNEGLTPDQVPGAYVSANLFKMLGVAPVLGRDFTSAEDTPGTPIIVL